MPYTAKKRIEDGKITIRYSTTKQDWKQKILGELNKYKIDNFDKKLIIKNLYLIRYYLLWF